MQTCEQMSNFDEKVIQLYLITDATGNFFCPVKHKEVTQSTVLSSGIIFKFSIFRAYTTQHLLQMLIISRIF